MHGGYTGRVLEVDLSRSEWAVSDLDPAMAADYIGGRGFTSKIQFDRTTPKTDPLGPDNVLIFATGPLTGTPASSTARFTIGARSPLTGLLGDSNIGGFWGPELKFAGFDMVIVTGKAEHPVYLWINDGAVEIRDAAALWGRTVFETEDALKRELGDKVRIASIGPAGENLVKYACVMSERFHAAGEKGMGAVMGSKNLKAIAVRGSQRVPLADEKGFKEAAKAVLATIMGDPIAALVPGIGTLRYVSGSHRRGALCTRNWQTGVFEGIENIRGERIVEKYKIGNHHCYACPIGCGQIVRLPKELFGGITVKPEYYPVVSFTSACGSDNVEAALKAIHLCNAYGLDAGEAGHAIAFAMECEQRGLLSAEVKGRVALNWGNYASILELVSMIALRKGLGELLGEGLRTVSHEVGRGSERFAVQVKGATLPTVDPRATKLYNLRYVTASRGGDHLRGQGILGDSLDAMPIAKAMDSVIFYEELCAWVDMLGVCKFTYHMDSSNVDSIRRKLDGLERLFVAAAGVRLDDAPERLRQLDRVLNARVGESRRTDTLPARFLEEPLPDGPRKGEVFDILDESLGEYYKRHGWDTATGLPKNQKEVVPQDSMASS
ncbi:MAG: aldehyde ferredoxin oxidoreductase family protein [Candidatus Bipolaricaulota bacterium]|nr:aldehyde ferredoxin oxidoreductase family protein [Candidatus Bipolaricaulota bacterium]